MDKNKRFSRVDEFEHFNYVASIVEHHVIPRKGDHFTVEAMRAVACQRYQIRSAPIPPCSTQTFNVHDFGYGGVTTAGGYPPVYYSATAAVAWLISRVFGLHSLFYPARVGSLLWLAMGSVATYVLARTFAATRAVSAAVALLATLCPLMLTQGSTVTPDSMALPAGAGTALAWLRWRNVPTVRSVSALSVVLTAVVLVKPNFLAIPVALALAELALAVQNDRRALFTSGAWSWRFPLVRTVLASAISLSWGVLWPLVFIVLDRPGVPIGPSTVAMGATPWNTEQALAAVPNSFQPLGSGPTFFVHTLDHGALILLSSIVNLLMISGAVAAALTTRHRLYPSHFGAVEHHEPVQQSRAIGYLACASLLVTAPVMYAITAASGRFIIFPSRYALFIVPLGLVSLVAIGGRLRNRLIVVPASALVVVVFWSLLH